MHHEEFWCLFLNQSNMIIHKEKLTHGGIDQSIVDARILFSIALDHLATAIVVAIQSSIRKFKTKSTGYTDYGKP